ncbi:MAG: hypothetical protein ACKVQS_10080 [Fimbriimonadaceae bacterium]
MKNGNHKKSILTVGLVVFLVGSAVAAQASSLVGSIEVTNSSFTTIPLLSSIAFAIARKRA